jgi:hypothetical protein
VIIAAGLALLLVAGRHQPATLPIRKEVAS